MSTYNLITSTTDKINQTLYINPFTSNGTVTPTSITLSTHSSNAFTSLLLPGKGNTDYGQKIVQSLIYLTNNFSSQYPPFNSLFGQCWYDSSTEGGQLKIFVNKFKLNVDVVQPTPITTAVFEINGNHVAELLSYGQLALFNTKTKQYHRIYIKKLIKDKTITQPGITIQYIGNVTKISLDTTKFDQHIDTGDAIINYNYIAGWVNIVQTNNALTADLDFNNKFNVKNLKTPTEDYHIGNRLFNDNRYVNLTGGTMTGKLLLTDNSEAISKKYVDDNRITRFGNLTDIEMPNPLPASSDLQLDPLLIELKNGTKWTTVKQSTLPFLLKTGGEISGEVTINNGLTVTGAVTLQENAQTGITNAAATREYVRSETQSLRAGVVSGASFDLNTGTLTLNTTRVASSDGTSTDIEIRGFATLNQSKQTGSIDHISQPNYYRGIVGNFLQQEFLSHPNYPKIVVKSAFERIAELLEYSRQPNERQVIKTAASGTIDKSITLNEATFVTGFNNLFVFVDGSKKIASTKGYQVIRHDDTSTTAVQGAGFFPTISTGLANNTTTIYSMIVTVDGTAITVTIDGTKAQTFNELVKQIDEKLFTGTGAAKKKVANAVLENGRILITSKKNGAGSTISITTATSLLNGLTGESLGTVEWSNTTKYTKNNKVKRTYKKNLSDTTNTVEYYTATQDNEGITPQDGDNNWRKTLNYVSGTVTASNGVTHDYEEDGFYGQQNNKITFITAPTNNQTIELIVTSPVLKY